MGIFAEECYGRMQIQMKKTMIDWLPATESVNYADIERGSCGMSVETLMALSESLDLTIDYIIYGIGNNENGYPGQTAEVSAILTMLNTS